jgi:hypothetical protein
MKFRIVEGNPQPEQKPTVPGCNVAVRLAQGGLLVARYETMAGPRLIEITAGRVVIFARPGVEGAPSELILPLPRPGGSGVGGDDEHELEIISLAPGAHTVTTPKAGGINGDKTMATFARVGANLRLIAMGGIWHTLAIHGVDLSPADESTIDQVLRLLPQRLKNSQLKF